jgi:hypothetical protein
MTSGTESCGGPFFAVTQCHDGGDEFVDSAVEVAYLPGNIKICR